ncbi:DUF2254 domain-containing protein [Pararhodobacter oceanensis]|uniref:DUF2254 domain-containing protein n=1 Tax=Pararhodobacter oceanensis TaxID=2172121 RepID=UPI003A8EA4C1
MFRLIVYLRRLSRKLWVRVALFAVLAIVSVLVSHLAAPLIPEALSGINDMIGPDAVTPILSIIASSMLAVSTFSLTTMVSAHRAAAATATPRVLRLMTSDPTTHTVLATFIGAFVYALTALILFYAGFGDGALVMLGVTLLVTLGVVVALIRWIAHLTDLGTMDDALARAENAAKSALTSFRKQPTLGARALTEAIIIPHDAQTLTAPVSGVLQMIDVEGLADCVQDGVWVLRRPGQVVLKGMPLAQFAGAAPGTEDALGDCFVIGNGRTFEQDPSFALTTLSEIASRALSPAVNDPGTAIEVISRLERLLWDWALAARGEDDRQPRVYMPLLSTQQLVEAAFDAIGRDGAGMIEVCGHLLASLDMLGKSADEGLAEAAQVARRRAQAHAERALTLEVDRQRLPRDSEAGPA